jgi:hypothetical protein
LINIIDRNHNLIPSGAIEELPLVNSPKVFGLHQNAEIGYYTQAAKEMWGHLVELQPQTGEHAIAKGVVIY